MRRFLLALVVALAIVAPAGAWTWPADGPVLLPFSFDPDASRRRPASTAGIDVGGRSGPWSAHRRRGSCRSPAPCPGQREVA